MALPHFIKYLYSNATEEIIRRGKKSYAQGNATFVDREDVMKAIFFRVKDEEYNVHYKVGVYQFHNEQKIDLRCNCAYSLSNICKHKAAALFVMQDLADKNLLSQQHLVYDQKHTLIKMNHLDARTIKMFTAFSNIALVESYLRRGKVHLIEEQDERVRAEVDIKGIPNQIVIRRNEDKYFDTSCDCNSETEHPLCLHKTIVLLYLLHTKGAHYFDSIRNWDKEKNQLLSIYGYSLQDVWQGKFEFIYQGGKPFLRVLDKTVHRISRPDNIKNAPNEFPDVVVHVNRPIQKKIAIKKLGIVFAAQSKQYPYICIEAVQGKVSEDGKTYVGNVERIDLNKSIDPTQFDDEDKYLLQQLRKLLPSELAKFLDKNSPFVGAWSSIKEEKNNKLIDETKSLVIEYWYPKLKKIFSDFATHPFVFFLPTIKKFTSKELIPIYFAAERVTLSFVVYQLPEYYQIAIFVELPNNTRVSFSKNEITSPLLFQYQNKLYCWQKQEDANIVSTFPTTGIKNIPIKNWQKRLEEIIIPLGEHYTIDFSNIPTEEIRDLQPSLKIVLQEEGDYLLLKLIFVYKEQLVMASEGKSILIVIQNGKIFVIHRTPEAEEKWLQTIEGLCDKFVYPNGKYAPALHFAHVLKNSWFFYFMDAMQKINVPVVGLDTLKKFRFNAANPTMQIHISSGTDWFNAKVDVQFGSQTVTIADIQKMFANKQQHITLKDGTVGSMPEEWLTKYASLFRLGEAIETNQLKINKHHLGVIEDLYEQRGNKGVTFELTDHYKNVFLSQSVPAVEVPSHLAATLRPYQKDGFSWLCYLNQMRWSGVLADDMGLGKTVQTLTLLHHFKQKNNTLKALVVCPTTLMYNWKSEVKKFTPMLQCFVHHGGTRTIKNLREEMDIVVTTYGTLRSDIKTLSEIEFDYVILDESQAIKNPNSKITKAIVLLQAKNKLCLSGTPLQNNTFDIFSQMNFLNPGMLGSVDFFKNEFAMPIDKLGDKEQKEHLRKLLKPFILRRTKEQVSKELPKKQEMILRCKMGDEQRAIYELYREEYKTKIIKSVDEFGIKKSQFTILQGLTRLRQICDSPSIIKVSDRFPSVSVKLDEIERELVENMGNHKALIFSQFLGMLSLIKERLQKLNIDFEYFDGSTNVQQREKAIQRFQSDNECRVFLISLKAGGVGLNLTAADYVYIVDPWWNPAVEQQAIDRTHRIGQTKNVFAYRMICTDTVEDKILVLQEKKKKLAQELIVDDSVFIQTLTRDDIEYLLG